jgi:hypothetical protein
MSSNSRTTKKPQNYHGNDYYHWFLQANHKLKTNKTRPEKGQWNRAERLKKEDVIMPQTH